MIPANSAPQKPPTHTENNVFLLRSVIPNKAGSVTPQTALTAIAAASAFLSLVFSRKAVAVAAPPSARFPINPATIIRGSKPTVAKEVITSGIKL